MATERSPAPYIAIAILIALLLAAIGFVAAMWMRPTMTPASATVVTDGDAITCPSPQHDATCFDTMVANQGGEAERVLLSRLRVW